MKKLTEKMQRENAETVSDEDYYRINLNIPFLNHVIMQWTARFVHYFSVVTQLLLQVPGMRRARLAKDSDAQAALQLSSSPADETRLIQKLKSRNAKWIFCYNDEQLPQSATEI